MTVNYVQKMSGQQINKMFQRQYFNYSMLPAFTLAQSDHALPNPDISMQASSPNSLCLYDQEKFDMQNRQHFEKGDDLNIDTDVLDCAMESLDMDFILSEALRLEDADFLNYSYGSSVAGDGLCQSDRWQNCQVKQEPIYQNDSNQMDIFNFEFSSPAKDENAMVEDILRSEWGGNYVGSFKNTLTGSRDPLISEVQVPNSVFHAQQVGNQQQVQSPVHQANSNVSQPIHWQGQQQVNNYTAASLGTSEGIKIKTEPDSDPPWDVSAAFRETDKMIKTECNSSHDERSFSCTRGERESITSCAHDSLADSREDGFESDNLEIDTDVDEDSVYLSDPGSPDSSSSRHSSPKRREKHRETQYFWQYNAQSKGPKGARLYIPKATEDPHVLHNFEDPVFDPDQTNNTIRHGGKARKGDGNDIAPNPRKLFQIGNELRKLNHNIDELTPPNDVPVTVKNKSRREKNKLASRACRLKKKAQHEANKVKLFGLEKEHSTLMKIIDTIHSEMRQHILSNEQKDVNMSERCEYLVQTYHHPRVAHRSADFVNGVLEKVAKGDASGGLKK